jgi:hypothetical protein
MMSFYGLLDRAPKGRDEGDPPEMWMRPPRRVRESRPMKRRKPGAVPGFR